MGKYRKIPVVIEAFQWSHENHVPGNGVLCPISSANAKEFGLRASERREHGIVETLEGNMLVRPGDWIITGVEGEKYCCKDSVFQKSYEPVSDLTPSEFQKQAVEEDDDVSKEVRHLENTSIPFAVVMEDESFVPPTAVDLLPEEKEAFVGEGGTFGGGGSNASWDDDDSKRSSPVDTSPSSISPNESYSDSSPSDSGSSSDYGSSSSDSCSDSSSSSSDSSCGSSD